MVSSSDAVQPVPSQLPPVEIEPPGEIQSPSSEGAVGGDGGGAGGEGRDQGQQETREEKLERLVSQTVLYAPK